MDMLVPYDSDVLETDVLKLSLAGMIGVQPC